ncbi:hypothetical protein AGOR_G00141890 [Albula goreensis]|uniref:C2H2-type domain-containing protein n=1 Tax=Albula goreensis TaxID=1534307 RepID=A0A8T3D9I3_9TELE|nr:hypothetical protein AGOR_G00141890 [Albula goreensis]
MKTESLMDQAACPGVGLTPSPDRRGGGEERMEGYPLSQEEMHILSNIKQEETEEELGEMESEAIRSIGDEEVIKLRVKEERDSEESERDETDAGDKAVRNAVSGPSAESSRFCWSPSTGQTDGVSPPVFSCSQCPFVHSEEEKLQQHIEKVHPEEHSGILRPGGNGAENPLPPSSTHQHPTP